MKLDFTNTIRKCDNCNYRTLRMNDNLNKIRECKRCDKGLLKVIEVKQ